MADPLLTAPLAAEDYLVVPVEPTAGALVDIAPFGVMLGWTGTAPLPWAREHLRPGEETPIDWRAHPLQPVPLGAGAACWRPLPGYGAAPANLGLEWPAPQDVWAVVVDYQAGTAPRPEEVDLQYWWWSWPTPPPAFGRLGWTRIDDRWCGYWKSADAQVTVAGTTHVHTFARLSAAEIPHAGELPVHFRRTLKLRLVYTTDRPPVVTLLRVFTGSRWRSVELVCEFGVEGRAARWDGQLTVTHGVLQAVQPLGFDGEDCFLPPDRWRMATQTASKGLQVRLLASDASPEQGDRTMVTLRTAQFSCSFLIQDLASEGPIVVRDSGIRVRPASAPVALALPSGQTILERVLATPEQSLGRAMAEIPALRKTDHRTPGQRYLPLGLDANRQEFALQYNGNVFCDGQAMKPKPGDRDRLLWPGETIAYRFGTGDPPDFREAEDAAVQSVRDGELPIVQTRWERESIAYEQEAFVSLLKGDLTAGGPPRGDEPTVLLLKFTARNQGAEPAVAHLWFTVQPAEALVVEDGTVLAVAGWEDGRRVAYTAPRLRAQVLQAAGSLQPTRLSGSDPDAVVYRRQLATGESDTLVLAIPFLTLTDAPDWAAVRALDYEAQRAAVIAYWRARIAAGAQLEVPEPAFTTFYRAVIPHILISTDHDLPTGLLMNPAATYRYDVFANETCLQVRMLDMRGYHDLARRYLEPFLHYQGVGILPGRFGSQRGVLHSAGPYTAAGYNLNHGWVLWTLAEHYRFTRDRDWLRQIAPHLLEACQWIVQERLASKRLDAQGRRVPEYGLLPPGQLEDPVEWCHWYSVNAYAYRGLQAAAEVLAAIDHPEAASLLAEAAAYRADIRASVAEAAILSPVVRLRDGTFIPHVPTRADIRGRDLGWVREVLYGPTHLIDCGVLAPDEPLAEWILLDHEDHRFLSESHGLGAPGGNWFSLGGITHQPNLVNTPLIYLRRDQVPLALRALYNAFVASLYRDVNVFAEWLLAFGIGGGPFYKTPDEAAWIIWLRCLLVQEEGDCLWLARGMPRRWLAHGQTIRVERAASHFGPLSYRIRSAVGEGRIVAEIDPPRRPPPAALRLRLRHPDRQQLRAVTCNGRVWERFDPLAECVELDGITEPVEVEAEY